MITFFRKIRQRLLTENKFYKYLIYAAGEIFLVVIGILIALQINNWNENRKNSHQEKQILNLLASEYQENLIEIDKKIDLRKKMINSANRLIHYIDNKQIAINIDSVSLHLNTIYSTPTFNPVEGVTNELLFSGKLYLIKNIQMKNIITNWKGQADRLIEYEEDLRHFSENQFSPYLSQHYSFRVLFQNYNTIEDLNSKSINKNIEFERLLNDQTFENFIIQITNYCRPANEESLNVKKKINEIIAIIDSEFKK